MLPWEGRGRGLEEECRRLGGGGHSYVPISIIDFDSLYTLSSWFCTHTIIFGLLFPGATGFLMDYGGTFLLVATLAVNTAP